MSYLKVISRTKKEYVIIFLIGILVSLMRPTVFGEIYSLPIGVVSFILLFTLFLVTKSKKLNQYEFFQLFILMSLYFYIFIRSGFDDPNKILDLIKGILINLFTVLIILFLLSRKKYGLYFYNGVATLIFLTSLCILISFSLMLSGYSVASLIITNIPYTYEGRGDVIFPFTFIYNEINGNYGGVSRLSGIYREPGCAPVFCCWAATYFYWQLNSSWKWFFIFVCVFASIVTLSTIGFLSLFTLIILICYRFKIRMQVLFIILILFFFIYFNFLYDIEYIGLKAKIESGSGSFEERYEQGMSILGIQNLIFGDGGGWSIYNTSNINVFSAARGFGLVFLILYLTIYFMSGKNYKFFLPALLPPLLIFLTSQPFFLEPAFIILIFSYLFLKNE